MTMISVRTDEKFKELLERIARKNDRDLSKEVINRLKRTLEQDKIDYDKSLSQ